VRRALRLAALPLLLAAPVAWAAPDLAGTWAGTMTHAGEEQVLVLSLEPAADGRLTLAISEPVVRFDHVVLGSVAPVAQGDSIRLGPFVFAYDSTAQTLSGVMPRAFVPVYSIPLVLHRVERFDTPARAALEAPEVQPAWTFTAGSPLWAGPAFDGGTVYVGAQDGWIYALDAGTGAKRWAYRAGGPVRARPTPAGEALYVQADDGYLYKLAAATGELRWRVKIVEGAIVRLPFDDPKSRFDRFASDVTVAGRKLYVGTQEGKLLALDAARGGKLWEFAAGDAILAAPALARGSVVFSSYDHFVYALDDRTGGLLWKRDTQGAVVSTPAVAGDRAVVGNRCYDLLGLDLATGETVWKDYVWGSWVESSASVRDSVAYVGSSDAAAVFAVVGRDGRKLWTADVHGWAWGQPAVTAARVYVGTSGLVGYPVQHLGGVLALDRASGKVSWRYACAPPDSGAFGFPGSPAVGAGRVFASSLDGRVYAFPQ
jgi:serine/threonine-protein kinase